MALTVTLHGLARGESRKSVTWVLSLLLTSLRPLPDEAEVSLERKPGRTQSPGRAASSSDADCHLCTLVNRSPH